MFNIRSFITGFAVLGTATVNAQLNVVPAVQSWTPQLGTFSVKGARIVVDRKYTKELDGIAADFKRELKELGCGSFSTTHGATKSNGICLTFAGKSNPFGGAGGYRIEINDRVDVVANLPTGIFYGTRTLLQLLAQDKTNLTLPCGTIVDWPQYAHRMLMLDVGRKPFPIEVLHDYLKIMSWYKLNELHLHLSDEAFGGQYTGFRVQCDTFPGLTSKDLFYTKKELRELQDEAERMGITITPEIDMPGHARVFTDYWPDLQNPKLSKSYLDVTNPQTVERLKKLLDEMIPIFDAPDFHIGTDEFNLGGMSAADKEKFGEAFREFINTMNAHIRSKGKSTRIWSGYEDMPGTTLPDPNVTIDMWVTRDAKTLIGQGHKVINSSDGQTYIVPGAHYYGVNNAGIYNNWEPWKISNDASKNPSPDDPHLLGGKLHVWNDQGPTGYDMTEIATLALPSIQAFAEKLWGTKGSKDYTEFQQRAALTLPVPGVTVFDPIPEKNADGVVLDLPREIVLGTTNAMKKLPFAGKPRSDLEWPWTLRMEVCKTSETGKRGVILSSDMIEICSDYSREEEITTKDVGGKEVKTKVVHRGIGLVRAAGSPGADPSASMKVNQVSHVYAGPAASNLMQDVSHTYGEALPLNQWVTLTIVGERGHTTLYVNGQLVGSRNDQMVCPLAWLGSKTGNSFIGKVRNLKVVNRALTTKDFETQPN
jgi:hexosaminidase